MSKPTPTQSELRSPELVEAIRLLDKALEGCLHQLRLGKPISLAIAVGGWTGQLGASVPQFKKVRPIAFDWRPTQEMIDDAGGPEMSAAIQAVMERSWKNLADPPIVGFMECTKDVQINHNLPADYAAALTACIVNRDPNPASCGKIVSRAVIDEISLNAKKVLKSQRGGEKPRPAVPIYSARVVAQGIDSGHYVIDLAPYFGALPFVFGQDQLAVEVNGRRDVPLEAYVTVSARRDTIPEGEPQWMFCYSGTSPQVKREPEQDPASKTWRDLPPLF